MTETFVDLIEAAATRLPTDARGHALRRTLREVGEWVPWGILTHRERAFLFAAALLHAAGRYPVEAEGADAARAATLREMARAIQGALGADPTPREARALRAWSCPRVLSEFARSARAAGARVPEGDPARGRYEALAQRFEAESGGPGTSPDAPSQRWG